MKSILLSAVLFAVWMCWSGHTSPFMIGLGMVSCLFSVYLSRRMGIVDEESVPIHLGLRPFTNYAPWLVKEIIKANVDVARRIIDPALPIEPKMVMVQASQKTEIGRVILANSITLTPGTVSVDLEDDSLSVHALTAEFAAEDASGEMDRRVSELESR